MIVDFIEGHMNPILIISKEETNRLSNLITKKTSLRKRVNTALIFYSWDKIHTKTLFQTDLWTKANHWWMTSNSFENQIKKTLTSIDAQQQCSSVQRFIEIARESGYSIQKLIFYELTQIPFSFNRWIPLELVLMHELEKLLDDSPPRELPPSEEGTK